jgi:3-isopropylmalate/(R)-2-methylmalate dehydratase large subunit
MNQPQTVIDKIWAAHEILRREDGDSLLWVDRHYVHEGSFHAFGKLAERSVKVAEPGLTFGVADHYVPTRGSRQHIANPELANMVRQVEENTAKHGVKLFGLGDPRQGIVHVVGPEQGLTLPGLMIVCGDSHTSTHGALGAYAFGIGASEVAHVLMTQTIWQKKPKRMRVTVNGTAAPSIEGRLTLCNMSIEAGARCGMIAPDEKTFTYLKGRPYAPKGTEFDRAVEEWSILVTDPGSTFEQEAALDAKNIAPIVTWGTSPEDALPIDAHVPDPSREPNEDRANYLREALEYMGIAPGKKITDIAVDRVFIGSCTNSRIEDLRAAAAVLAGRRSKVPGLVSAGSTLIKHQAEQEGLDRIFHDAGLEWGESGCSMCVGINGDLVAPGERCASTTNRNFRGRQGPGARTHLMSPAMVAAAAVAGHLADVRPLLEGRKV